MAGPWDKYRSGQPAQGGIVTKPADPTIPYRAPKARADLEGTVVDNRTAAAELPYAGPKAAAIATKTEREARTAGLPEGQQWSRDGTTVEPLPGYVPKTGTPGSDAVDKKFADEYVAWKTAGGFADVGKQLSQLRSVGKALKTQDNLTGPIVGNTPDFISNFVNPQAVATRESVEEVVQRSLRAVLGSQFTEKEGERLIARAYNPRQPESENRLRVARLRLQLTQAAKAKEDASRYFEKNGTLRGWNGRLWSFSDFDPERNAPNPPKQSGGGIKFLGFE